MRARPMKVMLIESTALTIPTRTENVVPAVTFAAAPIIRKPYCLPITPFTPDVESLATVNWFPIAMLPETISA